MFSPSVLRIIVVVALAAHGIAHAIALGGLIGQGVGGASASQVAVRSWLLPGLGPNAAAALAIPFWLVATVGFLLAALSFWGILVPDAPWRQIAVASAIASIVGVAFLAGTWPGSPNRTALDAEHRDRPDDGRRDPRHAAVAALAGAGSVRQVKAGVDR